MILNLLEAVIACFTLIKSIKEYRKLKKHYQTLLRLPLTDVAEVAAFLKDQPPYKKFLAAIKGIAKATNSNQVSSPTDKNILSLINVQPLTNKQSQLQASYKKVKWQKMLERFFWRRPKQLEKMSFGLKDLVGQSEMKVKDCGGTSLGGALNWVYSDRIWFEESTSWLVKGLKYIYTFLTNLFPLNLFLKKLKLGEEISFYGIMDGQYLLAVGEVFKDSEGQLRIDKPYYLTKQKAFLTKRINKRLLFMYWAQLLLLLIQIHAFYELAKTLYRLFRKRREKRKDEEEEQKRSEGEGDLVNCIICYTNVRSIALKPCRHYGFCRECYSSFREKGCPICKTPITGKIRIVKK